MVNKQHQTATNWHGKTKDMGNKINKHILLSVISSATAAFVVVAAITSLSFTVSPIFSIIFLGFPMFLTSFAFGISFTSKESVEYSKQLKKCSSIALLSAGMAVVYGICSIVWYSSTNHFTRKHDGIKAVWLDFICALVPWMVSVGIGMGLYFTTDSVRRMVDNGQ